MREKIFKISLIIVAVLFTIIFCILIIPPLMEHPDIIRAFAAGFVNPYASGYSVDVFCCWIILLIWIIYESPRVKYGWVCLVLGLVPGVAVGFAIYLIIRANALGRNNNSEVEK